jgi:hypothetical protein
MSGLGTGVAVGVGVIVGDAVLVGVADGVRGVEVGSGGVDAAGGCPPNEANDVISSSAPSAARTMTRIAKHPVRRDMRAILARQAQIPLSVK